MLLRNIVSGNVKKPVTCWLKTRLFNLDSRFTNKIKQLKRKKLDSKDAKKIGEDIGIDWKKVNLDEFTKGVNIEFEHGTKFPETNVTNNDKNMTGKIA